MRARESTGAFSIVIRLCTPLKSASPYTIGFFLQLAIVPTSSSQPSMMPTRMRWSTRSSGVRRAGSKAAMAARSRVSAASSARIARAEKSSMRLSYAWIPLPAAMDG